MFVSEESFHMSPQHEELQTDTFCNLLYLNSTIFHWSTTAHLCLSVQDLLCYLLDDGGFLIMSNQKEDWNKVSFSHLFTLSLLSRLSSGWAWAAVIFARWGCSSVTSIPTWCTLSITTPSTTASSRLTTSPCVNGCPAVRLEPHLEGCLWWDGTSGHKTQITHTWIWKIHVILLMQR